jgi:CRP/FNR family nitrogen fixation transcriptional regulator
MTLAYDTAAFTAPLALSDAMRRLGLRMTYEKDEEIFAQDEAADMVHLVVSGAVRTTRLLADGRRQVGAFYYPGDLIGVETTRTNRFSAEALCDTVVLAARRSALRAAAGEGRLERAIFEATRRELERTQDHVLVLGRKTACEKVASFLMDLAERDGGDLVAMPMSRQDMADYLGLTIETVSRMLTQLQGAAVVKFHGCRRFTVKRRDALEQMAI